MGNAGHVERAAFAAAWRTLVPLALVFAMLLLIRPAAAQLVDENLLVDVPSGYEIGFRDQKNNMLINEMVPKGETVDNWTEMVTVQIFRGLRATPEQFEGSVEKGWVNACPGGTERNIANADENGYQVLVWRLDCPRNPDTGKPEITFFKAIRGNDSFYVVQKAFKFAPSQEQVAHWMAYLRSVRVCDTRLPDRACPQVNSQ